MVIKGWRTCRYPFDPVAELKRKGIFAMADALMEMMAVQEEQLAAGGGDIASFSNCYGRECARFENVFAAAGADGVDEALLREKISSLLDANERLKAVALGRREEIMAAMAVIRRGRKGLKKYGLGEPRQSCRFVHRAA